MSETRTPTERLHAAAPELMDHILILLEGIDQVLDENGIEWDVDMDMRRRQAFDVIEAATGIRPTSSSDGGLPFRWRQAIAKEPPR